EGKDTPPELAHACLPGEEVLAKRIADVAFRGIVLIERIVFNGVNISQLRDRQTGTDAAKHGCDRGREQNFTEGCWLDIHFNFQKRLVDTRKSKLLKRRNCSSFFRKKPTPIGKAGVSQKWNRGGASDID